MRIERKGSDKKRETLCVDPKLYPQILLLLFLLLTACDEAQSPRATATAPSVPPRPTVGLPPYGTTDCMLPSRDKEGATHKWRPWNGAIKLYTTSRGETVIISNDTEEVWLALHLVDRRADQVHRLGELGRGRLTQLDYGVRLSDVSLTVRVAWIMCLTGEIFIDHSPVMLFPERPWTPLPPNYKAPTPRPMETPTWPHADLRPPNSARKI
ncbi:MAG: hypothetical protein UX31_C0003G0012 [Candidatus Nomurabacteria bacterium GW2011_GWA1_46_11]|uniref:Uncharacterized protein n=1 Tax=Candidatus Nomurabacteria bacterium GW2011_GWA1_46_11 TaxID=1618732 RepID=A0A0G1NPJ5_9BACT|nr:MAG: hypothetical protein UW69_C0039G0002 [Microgenomates group bacterium GW2011_GWA2_44_7]KKT78288.1 MAG: hypothetical protein UW73_C0004G0012 [Microgenomates group bacterium GW2011_GWB1_44_8]KKU22346.1 MAG: hypothetical protein UX31_C0003G0012 [Candidatus Nomurabacteria bacterium GW2011_GWA1_46_11]